MVSLINFNRKHSLGETLTKCKPIFKKSACFEIYFASQIYFSWQNTELIIAFSTYFAFPIFHVGVHRHCCNCWIAAV